MSARTALCALLALAASTPGHADEGMWTYNAFPGKLVKERYGFEPDAKWLEHVRLASARIAGGCSASFVSPDGLVMTNHHCAHPCMHALSSKDKDLVEAGFSAATLADEPVCPGFEINQLVDISDVTARINKATAGKTGEKFIAARKAEQAKIEKECGASDTVRCDVVSLYYGGAYNLYKYKRFQDVRLVFAPEFQIAFFGGDPDNFEFPRYDLDVSFLRVYEGGKPARSEHYFTWAASGAKDGDLAFVSGHPGGTDRLLTVAELEYERDVRMPEVLLHLAEYRGFLNEYTKRSAEAKRVAGKDLFYVENSLKAYKGEFEAIKDKDFFAAKIAAEKDLKDKVDANPEWKKKYAGAWDTIAAAKAAYKKLRKRYAYIERGSGFDSQLWGHARTLVRGSEEITKKNEKRLPAFRDASLPAVKQQLFSAEPIDKDYEIATLTWSLVKLREELGADHAFVKKVLGKQSPEELATFMVNGSRLFEPEARKKLWEGGKKAVKASTDPMIKLAFAIDAEGRALRKQVEDEIEAPMTRASELVAEARFAVYGTSSYPDATFTLRLSFGTVKGWEDDDGKVAPLTTLRGAFERATGRDPFALPRSWLLAKDKLPLDTPFNFVTTNDIIGGNSGSPVVSRDGEIIGIVFDGNIHSLGGNYGFDPKLNRTVAVHSDAILTALDKIYGATRVVEELRPPAAKKLSGK